MKKAVYSEEFREQALCKVYARGARSIRAVADELQGSYFTLKNWMKQTEKDGRVKGARPPQSWTAAERLEALGASYGLAGEALHAWCRQRGVYAHQLAQWKHEFCGGAGVGLVDGQALRQLKEDHRQLQRELARKEKALCEAGALLVLQKNHSMGAPLLVGIETLAPAHL